jgi:hypothetical protein
MRVMAKGASSWCPRLLRFGAMGGDIGSHVSR